MSFDRLGNFVPPTAVCPSDLHAPFSPGYSYESLIPSPSALTPGEILDKYYSDRRGNVHQTGNTSLVSVPVPVRGVDLVLGPSQIVVKFRAQHREGPSTGVPTTALFGHGANPAKLQGGGDIVLGQLGSSGLELIVTWPGYQRTLYPIQMVTSNGGGITRFHLARKLGAAYAMFFRRVENDKISSTDDFYKIAMHQGNNRRSDSPGIQFTQVHLVSLCNTVGGKWVAHVEIA